MSYEVVVACEAVGDVREPARSFACISRNERECGRQDGHTPTLPTERIDRTSGASCISSRDLGFRRRCGLEAMSSRELRGLGPAAGRFQGPRSVSGWERYYDQYRPHRALGMRSSMDRFSSAWTTYWVPAPIGPLCQHR